MILKFVGCVLIFSSSVLFGLDYIKRLNDRVYALHEINDLLNLIKIKISYELCDIPYLLKTLEDKYLIAKICVFYLENEHNLQTSWVNSIAEYGKKNHLKSEDICLLNDVVVCLGKTDIGGQISNLNMYLKLIEERLELTKSEVGSKSKVAFSTSIFTGLLISIILIWHLGGGTKSLLGLIDNIKKNKDIQIVVFVPKFNEKTARAQTPPLSYLIYYITFFYKCQTIFKSNCKLLENFKKTVYNFFLVCYNKMNIALLRRTSRGDTKA